MDVIKSTNHSTILQNVLVLQSYTKKLMLDTREIKKGAVKNEDQTATINEKRRNVNSKRKAVEHQHQLIISHQLT